MTKKWLMYVVTGLLCCGLIGLAIAKQNSTQKMTSRDRAKLELQAVQDNMAKHGVTPELQAREAALATQLKSGAKATAKSNVSFDVSTSAVAPAGTAVKSPAMDAQSTVQQNDADKAEVLYQDNLIKRWLSGEQMSPAEKALIEQTYHNSSNQSRPNVNPLDDQGGPNTFGYQWVDNMNGDTAQFVWEEPTAPVELTTIASSDDAAENLPFGFTFNFFGVGYTSGWASTNGVLAFDASQTTYWIDNCPVVPFTNPALMPYEDDGHCLYGASSDGGRVVYQQYADHVTITWDSVGTCCAANRDILDYQVQLWNNGKIKFQYRAINHLFDDGSTNGISPLIGIQDNGQTDPLTYYCNSTGDVNYTEALDGRAIWWFVNTAAVGRCCYYNGAEQCAENVSFEDCANLSGNFQINGTCAGNPCELGRCCYDNGNSCGDFTEPHCTALGGTWNAGMSCAGNPCTVITPGSDDCVNAVAVAVPGTYHSTTAGLTDLDPGFQCTLGSTDPYEGSNTAPDAWYSITGTGNTITVSLCDPGTLFDTQLLVVCSDDCINFNCVAGNDDNFSCTFGGATSEVIFCSELGREYYVVVDGWGSASGEYTMAITDDGVPCANPTPCVFTLGRCCYFDGVAMQCTENLANDCASLNGVWDEGLDCTTSPCVVGACCYGLGICAETSADVCATLGGVYHGDGSICENIECVNPCEFTCDPLAIAEGDDYTGYCDNSGTTDFNGGCNLDPPAYTDIQCGDIICGNTFTCDATGFRDTDWYRFTITEFSDVTVTGQSAFNGFLFGIIDITDCLSAFWWANTTITDCALGPQSATAFTLAPGTYAVVALYNTFTGLPNVSQYQISLTCTPAAPPTGRCCYDNGLSCQTISEEDCNGLGGTWDGGLTCELDPCPIPVDNDECATAEEIVVVPNGSVTVASGLSGATNSCTSVCDFTSSGPDQFYYITLTECRLIAVMADGPDIDSHISIYPDGQCCVTALDCNDDYGNHDFLDLYTWLPAELRPTNGVGSMIADTLPAGTYYIRAGHYSTIWQGDYDLTVWDFGPCANAPCDPVVDLAAYVVAAGNAGVNAELHFTAPQDGDYKVWSSTVTSNDGNPDDGADPDFALETTLTGLVAGPQVWSAAAGFATIKFFVVTGVCEAVQAPTGRCCYDNGASCGDLTQEDCGNLGGNWDQFMSCANDPCPPPAPVNDDCPGAIEVLNGTPISGSNVGALGTDITSCTTSDLYDVWYYYVAGTTDPITLTTCDAATTFDTSIGVYDGCGGAEVGCNDDDSNCTFSTVRSTLTFTPSTAGTYYIRIAGWNSNTGDFVLTVTQ